MSALFLRSILTLGEAAGVRDSRSVDWRSMCAFWNVRLDAHLGDVGRCRMERARRVVQPVASPKSTLVRRLIDRYGRGRALSGRRVCLRPAASRSFVRRRFFFADIFFTAVASGRAVALY